MFSSQAEALLTMVRAEIQRYGQSVVGCDKLLALVPRNDPIGAQFGHIFAIAEKEHWSFEFRTDGTVRFASLERPPRPIDVSEEPVAGLAQAAEG